MSDILFELSQGLAEAVETAGVSVVRVDARHRIPATGLVWSGDGMIVTAHHVVRRDENIRVGLPDGSSAIARLVGRDPVRDVALLGIDSLALQPAQLVVGDEPDSLRPGHLVLGLGRPGRSVQSVLGIVSGVTGGRRTPAGELVDRYLQTDILMYPGFSGGPLVDVAGRVLGMNSSALSRGASLTVPVSTLLQVVDELRAHGRVRRGYLGVSIQPVQLSPSLAEKLEQTHGLIVMAVHPGAPAEQASLMLGDILIKFGDRPIRRLDDLMAALAEDQVGSRVLLQIVRGGDLIEKEVTIGER